MDKDKQTVKEKVLIVDDSHLVCELFSKVLSEKGFETAVAYDGESALKIIGAGDFQVMLLDLLMPGISGMDVLRECRKSHPALCIIVVTGFGTEDNAAEAVREAADGYVIKDFVMNNAAEGLDVIIRHGLETRRLAIENIALTKQLKDLNSVLEAAYTRAKKEKDHFNSLFAHTEYAIVLVENTGTILGFNDYFVKLTGFPERELSAMRVFDAVESGSRDALKSLLNKTRPGVSHSLKTRIVTKAQKVVDVTVNVTPFKMGTERLTLVTIVTPR